jgi:hypothetical protein
LQDLDDAAAPLPAVTSIAMKLDEDFVPRLCVAQVVRSNEDVVCSGVSPGGHTRTSHILVGNQETCAGGGLFDGSLHKSGIGTGTQKAVACLPDLACCDQFLDGLSKLVPIFLGNIQ